jgi:hypothetical protein
MVLATIKVHGRTNDKLVWEAKIIPKPVSTVIHSLPTTTPSPPPYRTTKPSSAVVEPVPSNQDPTKHSHCTLKCSFLYISETVRPSIRALGSLRTASIKQFDIPCL